MAVSDQQADAAVYDAPIMRYLLAREYKDHIEILPQECSRQNYAIGLPPDSALRESINRTLLRHTSTLDWQETLFKFLGN
jgi:ABC-type amino acid transport substrate-binding protein